MTRLPFVIAPAAALTGDRIVIGDQHDNEAGPLAGAVYVYERVAGDWSFAAKLTPDPAHYPGQMGTTIAIRGTTIATGVPRSGEFQHDGGVQLLRELPGGWARGAYLVGTRLERSELGWGLALSDRHLAAGARMLDDGIGNTGGAFTYRMDCAIGTSYCGPAVPNSSGASASMAAEGSARIVDRDVVLVASGLPVSELGYFLVARRQGLAQPAGSAGFLCLGGEVGRFRAIAEIIEGPEASLRIDVGALPLAGAPGAAVGETWNFQCWFRDGSTSSFTDAVAIRFE
ncbi:MAG: hypothetical protein GY711_14400 [bacterium]|nr:hypothetical protein [bacterium]